MSFPTTPVLDDCQRPDEAPLSDGGQWSTRNVVSNLSLESQRIRTQAASGFGSMYWNAAVFGPDSEVYFTVTTLPGATSYLRLYLRLQNPGQAGETGYMCQFRNSDTSVNIYRETSKETFTSIATTGSVSFTTNDVLGFAVAADQLAAYKNGASVLTGTDATISAAGNIAIGGLNNGYRLLNFGGGTTVLASGIYPGGMII